MKMRYVEKGDRDYPQQLLPYERMPAGLYVIGKFPDPERPSVAIVGARNCSHYGYQESFRFGKALAAAGVQIISGMARGCDAAGHAGALEGGGATFAVLGCGADICYPPSNHDLYIQIPQCGGGILSEYEPGTPALGWHFPIRNRIISGLADIILVAEARKKSGSLITVEYALEQGKSVYAIPGRNRDPFSEGSNHLIAQGAGIAASPDLLLEELSAMQIRQKEPLKKENRSALLQSLKSEKDATEQETRLPDDLDPGLRKFAGMLEFDEKNIYELAEQSGISPAQANRFMLELCAAGYAKEVLPGYFCRL